MKPEVHAPDRKGCSTESEEPRASKPEPGLGPKEACSELPTERSRGGRGCFGNGQPLAPTVGHLGGWSGTKKMVALILPDTPVSDRSSVQPAACSQTPGVQQLSLWGVGEPFLPQNKW